MSDLCFRSKRWHNEVCWSTWSKRKHRGHSREVYRFTCKQMRAQTSLTFLFSLLQANLTLFQSSRNILVNKFCTTQLYKYFSNGIKRTPVKYATHQDSLSLCPHLGTTKTGCNRKTQALGKQNNQGQDDNSGERTKKQLDYASICQGLERPKQLCH